MTGRERERDRERESEGGGGGGQQDMIAVTMQERNLAPHTPLL